jgi:hypothetical protein
MLLWLTLQPKSVMKWYGNTKGLWVVVASDVPVKASASKINAMSTIRCKAVERLQMPSLLGSVGQYADGVSRRWEMVEVLGFWADESSVLVAVARREAWLKLVWGTRCA